MGKINKQESIHLHGSDWKLKLKVMARTSTRVRDARTGQFVPDREATRRPATTVRETIKVGPTKKQK